MEEHSEEQLEAMGLCPNRKDLDQSIPFGTWPPRKDFHDKIKASTIQPEMPTSDDMWRYEQGTNNVSAVRCNAGIHICKVNAIVTAGGVGGVDLTLADEFFLCKKESGEWSKKYLTSADGNHPKNSHLKNTSKSDNYSVETYNDYVPEQVLSSLNKYMTLYFNKYKPGNQLLTMGMIQFTFINFKCDLLMDEDDQIDYHLKDVHAIGGISALKWILSYRVLIKEVCKYTQFIHVVYQEV